MEVDPLENGFFVLFCFSDIWQRNYSRHRLLHCRRTLTIYVFSPGMEVEERGCRMTIIGFGMVLVGVLYTSCRFWCLAHFEALHRIKGVLASLITTGWIT